LGRVTVYDNGNDGVVDLIEGTEITARFDAEGRLAGKAGCNNYRAGYTVDGSQIHIWPAAMTRMMCSRPEGIMEQEAAYVAALATAARFTVTGDTLELRTTDGKLVARYVSATFTDTSAQSKAQA
jgi:heat shock protein HslJ